MMLVSLGGSSISNTDNKKRAVDDAIRAEGRISTCALSKDPMSKYSIVLERSTVIITRRFAAGSLRLHQAAEKGILSKGYIQLGEAAG